MTETLRLTSNLGASFELGADTIRKLDPTRGTTLELALANVVRVHAAVIGGGGAFELATADKRKLVVVSDREIGRGSPRLREPARSEFRAFAIELHRRLVASGQPIEFVGGLLFKKTYDPLAIPDKLLP